MFIRGVQIRNTLYGPNRDGIDVEACSNVMISDCDIYTCDDAICIKNGEGVAAVPVSRNITVTNCVLCTTCNALKIDSGVGQVRFENITFSNCALYSDLSPQDSGNSKHYRHLQDFRATSGIHIDSGYEGPEIAGVVISNISMQNQRAPFFMRVSSRTDKAGHTLPGKLREVLIDNVQATGQVLTSSITGLPNHNIENISLSHIRISSRERGKREWAHRRIPEFPHNYPDAFMLGSLPLTASIAVTCVA